MNCSSCGDWFCIIGNSKGKGSHSPDQITSVVTSGPGTSPGSSTSCDDQIPPSKNCYRLVVLGSAKVGKTSLVQRFLGGKFNENYTPTIEDFHRKLYRIRGEIYQLDILDTSGNHPFPAMRKLSFLTGDIFIIVFSMDSRDTFEEAIRFREQILETKLNAAAASTTSGITKKKNLPKIPMVIAGNKCEKEMRTVTSEEAKNYCANQECCSFVEVSAKKGLKVDELFYQLFINANLPPEMAPNYHKRVKRGMRGGNCSNNKSQTNKEKN